MSHHQITLPILPNRPSLHEAEDVVYGNVTLMQNDNLDLVVNATFEKEKLNYDDAYDNSQGNSIAFRKHLSNVLNLLKARVQPGSLLVDLGCGKGEFVELAQSDGWFKAIGFDTTYTGQNPSIEKRYLNENDRIKADIVVLRHVLEHIARPHEFLNLIRTVFGNTLIYIEVPDFGWIKRNQAFFDITYEHVNYFSGKSLSRMFDDKFLVNETTFEGQYLSFLSHIQNVSDNFDIEYCSGNWAHVPFDSLFPNLNQKLKEITYMLQNVDRIVVWGAATKGTLFIHHCMKNIQIMQKLYCAVDNNPKKQGKFIAGTGIKICSPNFIINEIRPSDLLIITNPNYSTEIINLFKKDDANPKFLIL